MFLTKTSEFFTANLFARPIPFYSSGKASKIMRVRGAGLHSGHSVLTCSTSAEEVNSTILAQKGGKGFRSLNKGLKCPLTVKYISMTLSGMSKSSENS